MSPGDSGLILLPAVLLLGTLEARAQEVTVKPAANPPTSPSSFAPPVPTLTPRAGLDGHPPLEADVLLRCEGRGHILRLRRRLFRQHG